MTGPIHRTLGERWGELSLVEQLGNVGAEVGRALRAKEAGNEARMIAAMERALELFEFTIGDVRHRDRLRELCLAREVFLDYLVGDNQYGSTAESLDRYFTQFGRAARR